MHAANTPPPPPKVHCDWVQSVRYCASLEGLFSASTDPGAALVFADVRGKRESSVFRIDKGVNSFDYSEAWNVIGGLAGSQHTCVFAVTHSAVPLAPPTPRPQPQEGWTARFACGIPMCRASRRPHCGATQRPSCSLALQMPTTTSSVSPRIRYSTHLPQG